MTRMENLVYVNTNRVMTDGHRDNSVGERKLIQDEVIGLPLCISKANRLLAVDDNGLAIAHFRRHSAMLKQSLALRSLARKVVSNYWYDADGERTVKTSGESDQVYVNGVFYGGSTNTAKFSLYVSPNLVANQGGRYTKHIYAGSQRIVSKVGDFASYGSDPRRIEYAGANTDGLSVDYKSKYAAQQQVIKDNYKFFDVPYNGTDNDNYADGEGFFASKATKVDDCCNDGSMEAAVAEARKAQTRAVSRSFKDPDNYENLQFFYHPDHLGSSSFITNLDGEVVQHIEYVPFGEVFIEERNNVWNTPYLFNAKEFDEETGMYYYGARYYDPRLSLWMSTDPLATYSPFNDENYIDGEHNNGVFNGMNNNPYIYCYQSPVKLFDPNGKQVVAVHGTFSNAETWENPDAIFNYCKSEFGNSEKNFSFKWSGGNFSSLRTLAAFKLVNHVRLLRKHIDKKEPITLVGHSHGGNVSIEAANIMARMSEFDGIPINILTINTPVRLDYQLNKKAAGRGHHVNVYDTSDPVQVCGGKVKIGIFQLGGVIGEMGPAGRKFKNARNIPVKNPQSYKEDYHNSHNRVWDWDTSKQ